MTGSNPLVGFLNLVQIALIGFLLGGGRGANPFGLVAAILGIELYCIYAYRNREGSES